MGGVTNPAVCAAAKAGLGTCVPGGRWGKGRAAFFRDMTAATAVGLVGSVALFPLVALQGTMTRRRVPCLPPVKPPYHGLVPGRGTTVRILAVGESTVAGVGLTHSDESVAATTARALARQTSRPVAWRAHGLSGATVSEAASRLLPRIRAVPADLLVIAFGVNDTLAYRSPSAFANDLAALVLAARERIGEAAVVITGVAPIACFPALPWPLGTILNWRSAALQEAAETLEGRLPRLVVERFAEPFGPHLFADDGFHPNMAAHALWGEEIASLALPLLANETERPSTAAGEVTTVTDRADYRSVPLLRQPNRSVSAPMVPQTTNAAEIQMVVTSNQTERDFDGSAIVSASG
jgi:lysophospholipase L1-like esterase